jgi:uncharacterized protein (TIGR02118 family)
MADARSTSPARAERTGKNVGGEALIGKAAVDGSDSPHFAIGILHFESADALQSALTGEHASEVIGDIRNFTDVQLIIQINERITP